MPLSRGNGLVMKEVGDLGLTSTSVMCARMCTCVYVMNGESVAGNIS